MPFRSGWVANIQPCVKCGETHLTVAGYDEAGKYIGRVCQSGHGCNKSTSSEPSK